MRLLALILLALPLAGQSAPVRAILTGPTSGGVYEIPAGVHDLDGLYVKRGHLWGSEERPVVISGAGPETVLRCPGVCYFEASQWVTFRDLVIEGAINSRHLRNWRFEGVTFRDAGIGWPQKVLFKTTGAPHPTWGPIDVGAGPVIFDGCTFDPSPNGKDAALDFVATQGVKILRSTWERCLRGCLQAKGGSGVREPFELAHNWIKDGGERGIFVGGKANTEFHDPPIEESGAEFGAASIHDNTIVGSEMGKSACFTAGTVSGPVVFERNLCIGQRGWVFRLLNENEHPASGGVRGVTVQTSIIVDWTPPQWPNTNVLAASGAIQWDTITVRDLVFGFPSRRQFWGYPDLGPAAFPPSEPLASTNILDNQDIEIERSADGKPVVVGWLGYGPRAEPKPKPVMACTTITTIPEQTHCWELEF